MSTWNRIWLSLCLSLSLALHVGEALCSEQREGSLLERAVLAGARQASSLLVEVLPLAARGGVYRLQLNGAPVLLQSANLNSPPSQVLEDLHSGCALQPGQQDASAPSFRFDDGDEGTVFCFRPSAETSWTALPEKLEALARHGNLGELGQLRGAFVRPAAQGSALLTVQTEGELVPERLFPETGDAPGREHRDLPSPRTLGGRRILSVELDGEVLVTAHEHSDTSSASLLARYEQTLRHASPGTPERRLRRGPSSLLVRLGKETFLITATDNERRPLLVTARLPQ